MVIAAASHAGEFTVETRPFTIETQFTATAVPEKGCVLLELEPNLWKDFRIIELAEHGCRMAKGDTLISFDTSAIDDKIAAARRTYEANTRTMAQAVADLKQLEDTSPNTLDALLQTAKTASEENSYFTKTRRKATAETAARNVEYYQQLLTNQQDELKELVNKPADSDYSNNILTHQKNAVAAAELALHAATLDYQRTIDITLPREAITLANTERDAASNLRQAEQDIPRQIQHGKLEIEALKTTLQQDRKTLAGLEADLTMCEFKAPADGWFYHGPVEHGRWFPIENLKSLFNDGKPILYRPFATFIPAAAKLVWTAFLDETVSRALKPDLTGTAILAGREDIEIPVKLTKLATIPGTDGTYRADLTATWPKDLSLATGTTALIRMISYQQTAAIVIPNKALSHVATGWTVEVKLAAGNSERRPVKRGRVTKNETEIVSGLEIGQVILTP